MGKWVSADVLDQALVMISGASRMMAVVGQPADYAAATAGSLADIAVGPDDFALGDANGGRRVLVAAKDAVPVVVAGTVDHVALVHDATQRLLYVTTCDAQLLEAGSAVNIDGWSVEIGAPV